MSHYSLAVITDEPDNIEKMLAPYDESIEVEPYIDITKEEIIKRAEERKNSYIEELKNGKELRDWQQEYLNANTDEELYQLERYEDEEYDENGNMLSKYNPNSKWDWYEIGGRWHNEIIVKENVEDAISGNPSFMDLSSHFKDSDNGFMWVDGARIKDIQFGKMEELKNQNNYYGMYWDLFVDGKKPETDEEKDFMEENINFYKKEYYLERYGTKEYFIKQKSMFICHALLDESGWHEVGEMGWFGVDDSTKDSETIFTEKFNEVLKNPENQNKYLVIVDCHI